MSDLILVGGYILGLGIGLAELFDVTPEEPPEGSHVASLPLMIFALGHVLILAAFYVGVQKYAPSRLGYELDLFIKRGIKRFKYLKRRYDALWA